MLKGVSASSSGRVGTRLVAGLSLLVLLIVLAFSLLIWNSRSDEPVQEADSVEAPGRTPRSPGTSTLSHGGPAPVGMSEPSESRRAVEPFLEPAYRTSHETSGSQKAGSAPATNRSPRTDGAGRGSGDQGP